jgi:hypothetical protein
MARRFGIDAAAPAAGKWRMRNRVHILMLVTLALGLWSDHPRDALAIPPGGDATITAAQKQVFAEVARSLVGAYEAFGRLEARYDAEGACPPGETEDCYIWRLRSANPTLRIQLSRVVAQRTGGTDGRYVGFVRFVDRSSREVKRIDIRLVYLHDGDRIDVRLSLRTVPGPLAARGGARRSHVLLGVAQDDGGFQAPVRRQGVVQAGRLERQGLALLDQG